MIKTLIEDEMFDSEFKKFFKAYGKKLKKVRQAMFGAYIKRFAGTTKKDQLKKGSSNLQKDWETKNKGLANSIKDAKREQSKLTKNGSISPKKLSPEDKKQYDKLGRQIKSGNLTLSNKRRELKADSRKSEVKTQDLRLSRRLKKSKIEKKRKNSMSEAELTGPKPGEFAVAWKSLTPKEKAYFIKDFNEKFNNAAKSVDAGYDDDWLGKRKSANEKYNKMKKKDDKDGK